MATNLSAESLKAIADLIDSRLAAAISLAVSEVEGTLEARLLERLQSQLDVRLAAIETKHATDIHALKERLDFVNVHNTQLRKIIHSLEDDADDLHDRLEDQEQRARRFNVRVENIPFDGSPRDETDDALSAKLITEFAELNIAISPSEIVRCHRTGKPRLVDGAQVAQAIIKVSSWSARVKINSVNRLARQKKRSVRVHHDLTRERLDRLQYARARINRAMSEKHPQGSSNNLEDAEKCFAFATLNCDTIMRLQGQTFVFRSHEEFDDLFRQNFSFE